LSASRPGRFTPGERAAGIHWIGGWVDPRAGLNDMEKWKFLTPAGLELRPSVVQPAASRYADCAIPAHQHQETKKKETLTCEELCV
jgi:hypothetical protein